MKKTNLIFNAVLIIIVSVCSFQNASAQIDLSTLSPGDILADQFQAKGIRFFPYSNSIKGEIKSTPAGNIGLFDVCNGCEFFPSAASVVFTSLHQQIKVDYGITPRGGTVAITQQVNVTAYDAGGTVIGSGAGTVSSSSGFANEIIVSTASPVIASIKVEAIDPTANTNLGISNIFIDSPNFISPDFSLQGNNFFDLVSGGNNVPAQFTIIRYGGSAGNITFSATGLPPGVQAVFPFNPESGNVCTVALVTNSSASNGSYTIDIVGTPASPSVGPAPRIFPVNIRVGQAFNLFGLRNIDFDDIPSDNSNQGKVSIPLTIIRNGLVPGPATISISNVPPGLTATFSKANLPFAGYSTGDNTVLNLTAQVGYDVSTIMVIHITNGTLSDDFLIGTSGSVARINKNFTIKGTFLTEQKGFIRPIDGATVEIYKDVHYWYDDMVAETTTDANGNFEVPVAAGGIDSYYAKLRLTDLETILQNSWSGDVWDINSINRSDNSSANVDLGATLIVRDDGTTTTTRATAWQGGHYATQDYAKVSGGYYPGYSGQYQIKVWESIGSAFTLLTETEWPENHSTIFPGGDEPGLTDNFFDYSRNFHEFGHTLRHSADGDMLHFIYDAGRFTYAQSHNGCSNNNEGFAFNEGWAEFWAMEPDEFDKHQSSFYPCAIVTDFSIEYKVAYDLRKLMECAGKTKYDMLKVLLANAGAIHSEEEYRGRFQAMFPDIDMNRCSVFDDAAAKMNGSATQTQLPPPPPPQEADSAQLLRNMERYIQAATLLADSLQQNLKDAEAASEGIKKDQNTDPNKLVETICRPFLLQAQIKAAGLLQSVYTHELDAIKKGQRIRPQYSMDFIFGASRAATDFDKEIRNILSTMLEQDIKAIDPFVAGDHSGALKKIVAGMKQKLQLLPLKTGIGQNWYSILNMPKLDGERAISPGGQKSKHANVFILIGVLILVFLLIIFLLRRKK